MKKNDIRIYIILAIAIIVFCVIAFVCPFNTEKLFWLGFACAIVAILAQLYIYNVSLKKPGARSKFFGYPIARIGFIYLGVQMVVSFAEMIISDKAPMWPFVILNVVIFALAVVGVVVTEAVRDEIIHQDESLKIQVFNMRELQSLALSMVGRCEDAEAKKAIQSLSDDLKFSDPVSSPETLIKESELKTVVNDIQKALFDNDYASVKALCASAGSTLAERNRICKLSKINNK